MPNNFKLSGDYYVSKAGNDANAGTSPDAPLLTIQAALDKITTASVTRTIVVGSGVYKERIVKGLPNSSTTYIIGDGYCILDGQFGLDSSFSTFSGIVNLYVIGFEIRNYNSISFNVSGGNLFYITFQNCAIKNCNIFQNCPTANNNAVVITYSRCVIINTKGLNQPPNNANNSGAITAQNLATYFDGSILINSSFLGTKVFLIGAALGGSTTGCVDGMKNTYVDPNSSFSIHATIFNSTNTLNQTQNPNLYINNNIQGKIICDWTGSVSGNNSVGAALYLAQHRIDYPTFNINSFSADPLFNNPRLLDFTLQAGSPNVSASTDYISNIGGTEYAVSYTASSAAFTTNATSQSLDYRGLYYGISGSAVSGSITSGPMFLQWPRTKPMTSINWMGDLEFNKTITASFAGNTNVPAYTTFTSASGEAGANPDRLKIAMRFSTQQTQPSTDAEWDNNGYWTPGTYQLFEINQKPTIDYKGTGNGDASFAGNSSVGDLVPSWIQTEIILRNDYNR